MVWPCGVVRGMWSQVGASSHWAELVSGLHREQPWARVVRCFVLGLELGYRAAHRALHSETLRKQE